MQNSRANVYAYTDAVTSRNNFVVSRRHHLYKNWLTKRNPT